MTIWFADWELTSSVWTLNFGFLGRGDGSFWGSPGRLRTHAQKLAGDEIFFLRKYRLLATNSYWALAVFAWKLRRNKEELKWSWCSNAHFWRVTKLSSTETKRSNWPNSDHGQKEIIDWGKKLSQLVNNFSSKDKFNLLWISICSRPKPWIRTKSWRTAENWTQKRQFSF